MSKRNNQGKLVMASWIDVDVGRQKRLCSQVWNMSLIPTHCLAKPPKLPARAVVPSPTIDGPSIAENVSCRVCFIPVGQGCLHSQWMATASAVLSAAICLRYALMPWCPRMPARPSFACPKLPMFWTGNVFDA